MNAVKAKPKAKSYTPILGGFIPLAALWDEGSDASLFPSEASARWFIRIHRAALTEARAIAIHAGRTYVHRERFEAVAQQVALAQADRKE